MGLPSSNYRSSLLLIEKVKKFKTDLEKKLKVEVILWDEEYSSEIAKKRVIESVTRKNKRKDKGLIDQHSAAILLQEYLDSLKME